MANLLPLIKLTPFLVHSTVLVAPPVVVKVRVNTGGFSLIRENSIALPIVRVP
jgi:hypothetical protein